MSAPVHVVADPERAAVMLDPLRLRLLHELAEPDSATGLARRLGIPRQKLNYHLRLLEEQGLIELVEERRKRNCTERVVRAVARSYLLSPATLGDLAADPARIEDRTSSAYLVAAAAQVVREVAVQRERADKAGRKLPTLTLQADVRFATPEAQHAFAEELTRAVARLAAKYQDDGARDGRWFRLLTGVYPVPRDGARK